MDNERSIPRVRSTRTGGGNQEDDSRGQTRLAPEFRFDCGGLIEKGYAGLACIAADLVVTFRATGMIDVFDRRNWRHVAYLDFDLRREIHLDSAFGSPLIGLPFSAAFRQAHGIDLTRFDDLRHHHHYGFFVQAGYRNKGCQGVWNLDELMMAIALAYADATRCPWFAIKPTGDTAPYYIRKFGAVRPLATGAESVLHIPLGSARGSLPHVGPVKDNRQKLFLSVAGSADAAWQLG